jgi:thymidylate kinase
MTDAPGGHRGVPAGRRRRGLRVVLLGPDGAGKSTLSRGLAGSLGVPVDEIYMGVFGVGGRWQRICRYLPGAGMVTRVLRLWWRSARAGAAVRRGHVVVFDRYTYDAGLRPGTRDLRSRISYWATERAVPAPDVAVILDAPGELMFARKQEHDIETLEQRRQWYLRLAGELPPSVEVLVVDASKPADEVLAVTRTAVLAAAGRA